MNVRSKCNSFKLCSLFLLFTRSIIFNAWLFVVNLAIELLISNLTCSLILINWWLIEGRYRPVFVITRRTSVTVTTNESLISDWAAPDHEEGRDPDQEPEAFRQVQEEEGGDGGLLQDWPGWPLGHGHGNGQWILLRLTDERILSPGQCCDNSLCPHANSPAFSQMAPMSSQFMSHSSMYMGSMSSMAAGMQQPHSAFSLGSNSSPATNGLGNSMVSW